MSDATPVLNEGSDEESNHPNDSESDSEEEGGTVLNSSATLVASFSDEASCSTSPSSEYTESTESDVSFNSEVMSFSSLSDAQDPTESDSELPIATSSSSDPASLLGYKFVLDNIDKTVKPRHMTLDSRTKSLHYVQLYCVKDRIDFSSLPNTQSTDMKCLYDILPSATDYSELKQSITSIVARIVVENIPFFASDFKGLIPKHGPHQYAAQMKEKSHVVCIHN